MTLTDIDLTSPAIKYLQTSEDWVTASCSPLRSNLARPVYCILGIPIDAVDLKTVAQRIETAAIARENLLVSTPNLNFIVSSLSDPDFRESLLDSDLCPPDGTPIIWIARLLGLPINERAAGADLFDRLKFRGPGTPRLTVFLFGGAKGVAAAAAGKLNAPQSSLTCVGTMDPGFGDIGEMSKDHMIDAINSSGADFLVVALGAKKGQSWLRRNHHRLTIPIRSHLGAAINFQAGTVKRAPAIIRAWGFEWLWRIKEERHLWRRYRDDGLVLLRLLLTRVLPLAVISRWQLLWAKSHDLLVRMSLSDRSTMISLYGAATEKNVPKARSWFEEAATKGKDLIVDLSGTELIDARFLGLLLVLRKELGGRGAKLIFAAVPRAIERVFRLNELGFLLSVGSGL